MIRRVWRVVHPLLTLAAVGCCGYLLLRPTAPVPSGRASEEADYTLRHFLGARWIGGDYELPAGEQYAVVLLMEFKEGEYRRTYLRRVWDAKHDGRVLRTQLMWGEGPNGKRAVLIDWGMTTYTGEFAELDGPLGRIYGAAKCDEVRGFRAVGYASSKDIRAGYERLENIGGLDCAEIIESRKRVLVLGVKPFPDEASAEQYVAQLNAER